MSSMQEASEEQINYRTAGTKALNTGYVVKGYQPGQGKVCVNSIPSKLETLLFHGEREHRAFGSQSLRFTEAEDGSGSQAGPAAYSIPSTFNAVGNAPSWGKKGTGGFASVSKRFVPRGRNFAPGPGAYDMNAAMLRGQLRSEPQREQAAPLANFCPHTSRNPLKRTYAIPGPGQYDTRKEIAPPLNPMQTAGTASFESNSKRLFGKPMATQGPGPGQYTVIPTSRLNDAETGIPSRNFRAPIEKRYVSVCPEVHSGPGLRGLSHADKDGEFVKPASMLRDDLKPGPGAYTLPTTLNTGVGARGGVESPRATQTVVVERSDTATKNFEKIKNQRDEAKMNRPGPGAYDPKVDFTRGDVKRNITAFHSHSLQRERAGAKRAPGPAYYKIGRPNLDKKSFHLNLKGQFIP